MAKICGLAIAGARQDFQSIVNADVPELPAACVKQRVAACWRGPHGDTGSLAVQVRSHPGIEVSDDDYLCCLNDQGFNISSVVPRGRVAGRFGRPPAARPGHVIRCACLQLVGHQRAHVAASLICAVGCHCRSIPAQVTNVAASVLTR